MGKFWEKLKSGNITYNGTTYYGAYSTFTHKLIVILPLLLVNGIAITGQMGWAKDNLPTWGLAGQIAFAFGLESVAVFLAYHAYLCEKRNDSALRLKLASYAFALFVASINYSHYAKQWNKPDAVAIVVGMMSAASPILWGIYSRSESRAILFQRGLIDEHMLRMGNRWIWHPIRSFKVMYWATWEGENKPHKAIAGWEESEVEKAKEKALKNINPTMNGYSHSTEVERLNN